MTRSNAVRRNAARLAALALMALVSVPAYAADLKQSPKIAPGLPASSNPAGAAAVGRLINPQIIDPSVPLPTPNLSERIDADQPMHKPQIYGRGEQGGPNGSILEGLVGVRIPFPAAAGAGRVNTTYGSGNQVSEAPSRSR